MSIAPFLALAGARPATEALGRTSVLTLDMALLQARLIPSGEGFISGDG